MIPATRFSRSRRRLCAGALLGAVTLLCQGGMALGAEKNFLADRHQTHGMACDACHREAPPQRAVPTEVCLGCHGPAAKLAETTSKVRPNPHASHLDELPCESCHHGHTLPENYCAVCHNYGFRLRVK